MLGEVKTIKSLFSWKELLGNAGAMKSARHPIRGYVTTLCFWQLMEIGLLDSFENGNPVPLETFAKTHNLNEEILTFICQYLHRNGYLIIKNGAVTPSSKGKKFWKQSYGVFHLFYAYEPLFSTLSHQIRNRAQFGKDLFRREDEVARGFSELGKSFLFKIMARIIQQEGFKSIVDLGCQEVELSSFLNQQIGPIRCLGIDHSQAMVDRAKLRIQKEKITGRVEVILGDIFNIDQLGIDFSPYEVVTAIDLFHGYFYQGEDKLLELFKKIKCAFPNHHFLFSEICLPPHAAMKRITYPFVEHEFFHGLTQQKTFAYGQLESLLQRSGFRLKKVWDLHKIAGRLTLLLC